MAQNSSRQTRSEQRDAAREKARALREASVRKERTRSTAIKISIVAAVLIVAGLIGGSIFGAVKQAQNANAVPANMIYDNGIKIGTNLEAFTTSHTPAPAASSSNATVPNIIIYLDYQCPICDTFEQGNADQLRQWAKSGAATLEIHPISFLDGRASPNTYSSRAANSALCVANYSPNNFLDYSNLLFQHQPAEGTPGPENPELIKRTTEAGVQNAAKIADCINNKTYGNWLTNTTNTVLGSGYKVKGATFGVTGTPTIVVNGQQYSWTTEAELVSPARFAAWFQQVIKG
jgi:protein-disulfide isomerase